MSRTSFVAGNWKMNTLKASASSLAKAVAAGAPAGADVGIAPPFVYLDAVGPAIAGSRILLGAQDVYFEKSGAFTGEISVEMLQDLNVRFVLTGHSERRHILHEDPILIGLKASAVYRAGLILIHCVGETLEQRQASQTFAVVQHQLDELKRSEIEDPDRLVIAYEPVWAIGTGRNATADQAQEVHAYLRDLIADRWNSDYAYRVRIQYGGSVSPQNAREIFSRNDVDGGLIGGASLKAESFLAIVKSAKELNH